MIILFYLDPLWGIEAILQTSNLALNHASSYKNASLNLNTFWTDSGIFVKIIVMVKRNQNKYDRGREEKYTSIVL